MTKYFFESIAHKLSGPYPPISLSGLEHTNPRIFPIWFNASSNFSYSHPIHKLARTPSIWTNNSFNPNLSTTRFVLIACACGIVLIVLWYCMPARGDKIAALKALPAFNISWERTGSILFVYSAWIWHKYPFVLLSFSLSFTILIAFAASSHCIFIAFSKAFLCATIFSSTFASFEYLTAAKFSLQVVTHCASFSNE